LSFDIYLSMDLFSEGNQPFWRSPS